MQNSNCLLLAYALLVSERALLSEEDYDNLRRRAILYAMAIKEPLLCYLLLSREIEDTKKHKAISSLLLSHAPIASIRDLNQMEQSIKQNYDLALAQTKEEYKLLYDATVLQFAQTTQKELDENIKSRLQSSLTKTEITTLLNTLQAMEDRSSFTLMQLEKLSVPIPSNDSKELTDLQSEINTILNKSGIPDKNSATMPNVTKIQRLISDKNNLLLEVAVKFKANK